MIGQSISHYKILSKLGEGGMGVVYKAQDIALQRTVALKFLASHLVSNEDVRKRFLREARAAAALNHPNICTVYEVGDSAGRTFLSMAYLEGQELAAQIAEGPIEVERALGLATQFADGLADAHSKGVVHRDIKPANLFVTNSGRGVILDFGLAQLASADSKLTREGTTLGTCAYMSPEQATGPDVDARTDVWALGCVLYEMLAGHPPFQGQYEQAIVYSILNEKPEPLPASAERLQDIVLKCLTKAPEGRYGDGSELLAALRKARSSDPEAKSASTGEQPAQRPSIVVLPFQNRGRDEEEEYFADGVTEDVISTLGKIEGLRVIPRGSAFQFKGKRPALHELVKSLRVTHVLDGSVRQAGDRLRITVELIEAGEGDQVWTERYDRMMADIFDVQDEISQAIADALKAKLTGATRSTGVRRTKSIDAYQMYLKGRQCWATCSESGLRKAISCFEKALEHDGQYPEPRSGLADAYLFLGWFGFAPPREVMPKAREEALHALELDATIAEAYASLAVVQYAYDWDYAAAEQSFRKAIELDPTAGPPRFHFSVFLDVCGRSEEALKQCRTALELDPLNSFANRRLSGTLLFAGDWEAALEQALKTLDVDPSYSPVMLNAAMAHYMLGRPVEALQTVEAARSLAPEDPLTLAHLAMLQAGAGRAGDARRTVEHMEALRSQRYVGAAVISWPYLHLGDMDAAFGWLETALEERDSLLSMIGCFPLLKGFAKEPRVQDVLRRIGIP